ncbi:MAG: hypothetical protein ACRDQD_27120 [Nocardioidaceae bacterium]
MVWLEGFGRDADAEEAHLTEVAASTVHVGFYFADRWPAAETY